MLSLLRAFCIACCVAGFTYSAQAQEVVTTVFGLRPSGGSSQRVVNLGDSKSGAVQVLGPPTKTSREYFEMDEAWVTVFHYGNNRLFFLKNELALVELHDARFTVGKPGTTGFRVGSVLPKTKPMAAKPALAFGRFEVNYKAGKSRNLLYSAASYGNMKTPQGQVVDVVYEIHYDQKGRVSHIFLDSTYD